MAIRISLVVLSILALAWIGVLLRDQEVGQAAFERLYEDPRAPAGVYAHEISRLEDAELLNPDSTWQLYRGSLWAERRPKEALRILEDLVRIEPQSFDAWRVLALTARASDPRRSRQAFERARSLNPKGID